MSSSTLLSYVNQQPATSSSVYGRNGKRPIGNKNHSKNIVLENNYIESFCLMFSLASAHDTARWEMGAEREGIWRNAKST